MSWIAFPVFRIIKMQGSFVMVSYIPIGAVKGLHYLSAVPFKFQQKQIKIQLADSLQGVISQLLLPRADGQGRVLATEIMTATSGIRNLVREGEVAQILSLNQMGAQYGMHTMDKCLKDLYRKKVITKEMALSKVKNPVEFDNL